MTLLEFIHDIPAIRDEAKTLWGERKIIKEVITDEGARRTYYSQEYGYKEHLDALMKSDDPLAYYEQHKPKGKL